MEAKNLLIGIALSVLCLAIANNIPSLFSTWAADLQEMLRYVFLILSIFGIMMGLFK